MQKSCIEAKGVKDPDGYGRVSRLRFGTQRAHRAVYEAKHGKIPKGLVIDHLCRNRACINVEHMEVVTVVENVRRGKTAKLNLGYVIRIKLLKLNGLTDEAIARMFGVNQSQISRVVNNRTWKRG